MASPDAIGVVRSAKDGEEYQAPAFTGALYIFPESIDRLAEELRGKVPFAWGPEATEFGIREFAIRDPDGYALVFAERA